MPKHGFLTPKAISNRIKSKGLQKLRWYCQVCQKQCRDENGFNCHSTSESHQRQLLLVAENPDKFVDAFSNDFRDDFLNLLKCRFGTKRVHANQVYQEYISDRNHLHMNATQWETLTDFVKWLGRESYCEVDETEKGWFIAWIDRDPETIRRQELARKQEKLKMDDEERMAKFFQKQMERDLEKARDRPETVYTDLKKENEDEKVIFGMKSTDKPKKVVIDMKHNPLTKGDTTNVFQKKSKDKSGEKRKTALEEIMEIEKAAQEKKSRKDCWLAPGIIVKIVSKEYGDDLYKKKAVVDNLKNPFKGIIKVIDSGKKVCLNQSDLETVIPAVGRKVLILNGTYRGQEAILTEVNFDKFSVDIKISSGAFKGKILKSVKYEDISKIHAQ